MFVDDDEITRMIIGTWLAEENYAVTECSCAEDAIRIATVTPPSIVVTDLQMTGLSGLDLTVHIKKLLPETPVVLITSTSDMNATVQALNVGVDHLLIKPIDRTRLMGYLRRLSDEIATKQALAAAREDLRLKTETLERIRANEGAVGARVQEMILYRAPAKTIGPVRSAHRLAPALQVSGDFLDCFPHSPDCFDVVIGDAMGKGLGAALLSTGVKTAMMRQFMRAPADAHSTEPRNRTADLLPALGSLMADVRDQVHFAFSSLESFVTVMCVRLQLKLGVVEWIDCGHNKMIVLRRNSPHCILLHGDNLPLGIAPTEAYSSRKAPLLCGDRIVLLTDGLIETTSTSGVALDLSSILHELLATRHMDIDSAADRILALSDVTVSGHSTADDRTVLLLDLTENCPGVRSFDARFEASTTALPHARDWLLDSVRELVAATGSKPGDDWSTALELGFTETFANIVRHGVNAVEMLQWTERIWILAVCCNSEIYLELQYKGAEFEERRHHSRAPAAEQLAEDGYGLSLIEACFDEVRYYSDPSGIQAVTLRKAFGSPASSTGSGASA
jgi:phosphoserine phosphatase RsbU/P